MKKKIVLAYSGGLDTSVILKWLLEEGYEVICYIADVGQQEDFEAVKAKALSLGASAAYIEDLKEEFIKGFIFPALQGNKLGRTKDAERNKIFIIYCRCDEFHPLFLNIQKQLQ